MSLRSVWIAGFQARPPQRPTNCDLTANHDVCNGAFADVSFALGSLLIAFLVGALVYLRWQRGRRPPEGAERLRRKLRQRSLLRRLASRG